MGRLRSSVSEQTASPVAEASPLATGILDEYIRSPPSGEAAINIFRGEWSSKLPPPYDSCTGTSSLFDDARITWAETLLNGFEGLRILELGPLEAGHTTMLERAGAASIKAIEANSRSFLKCLIVKELLGLQRSSFLHGDFMEYLPNTPDRYDLCVASGVLYHMRDPVEALRLIGGVSDTILLWTHYFDEEAVMKRPELVAKFSSRASKNMGEFGYDEYRYEYGDALNWQGFCGGSSSYSNWLSRDAIIWVLQNLGFDSIEIEFDDLNHQNGPAFAVLARRSVSSGTV